MDSKVHINNETLRRLVRDIDSRPVPARLRRPNGELVAERFRRMHTGDLRERIALR